MTRTGVCSSFSKETMCALAVGTARDWLFRSRELIESKSFAPNGSTIDGAAAKAEQSEGKLRLRSERSWSKSGRLERVKEIKVFASKKFQIIMNDRMRFIQDQNCMSFERYIHTIYQHIYISAML